MQEYSQNINPSFWSRKMIQTFIHLYKENQCLYDRNHQDFKNKNVRTDILNNMLRQMQLFIPNLQLKDIKVKLKAMLIQFFEENSIVQVAESAGSSCVPKLWCYDQLKFLRKHITDDVHSFWKDCSEDNDAQNESSDASDTTELNTILSLPNYRWEREDTKIFIKLLKNYKILYDRKHKDYYYKDLRMIAHNKLLHKAKKIDPKINLKHVCYKVANLRKQYKTEMERLRVAQENNEPYTHKLWCFDILKELYGDETKIHSEVRNNAKYMGHNNSIQGSEETNSNDIINDETFAFEEIHDIIEETEENFTQDYSSKPIVEYVNNFEDDTEDDTEHLQSAKKFCDKVDCDATVMSLSEESNVLASPQNNKKSEQSKKSIRNSEDANYEWLGNLVATQLADVLPKYHTEFVTDIQNISRTYILKSKAKEGENMTSKSSAQVSVISNTTSHKDIVLPRSSNVALNLHFL